MGSDTNHSQSFGEKKLVLKAFDATEKMDEYERELAILNLVPQNNQYVLSVYDHGESYEGMPPITFKSAENKVTTNQLYCFIVMEQITI